MNTIANCSKKLIIFIVNHYKYYYNQLNMLEQTTMEDK
jgi:hypothetical protein